MLDGLGQASTPDTPRLPPGAGPWFRSFSDQDSLPVTSRAQTLCVSMVISRPARALYSFVTSTRWPLRRERFAAGGNGSSSRPPHLVCRRRLDRRPSNGLLGFDHPLPGLPRAPAQLGAIDRWVPELLSNCGPSSTPEKPRQLQLPPTR